MYMYQYTHTINALQLKATQFVTTRNLVEFAEIGTLLSLVCKYTIQWQFTPQQLGGGQTIRCFRSSVTVIAVGHGIPKYVWGALIT